MIAFWLMTSSWPLRLSSLPSGIKIGHAFAPSFLRMSLTAVSKSAPDAVHLVDERDARNVVFGRLAPDGFGLRLHTGHAAKTAIAPSSTRRNARLRP